MGGFIFHKVNSRELQSSELVAAYIAVLILFGIFYNSIENWFPQKNSLVIFLTLF